MDSFHRRLSVRFFMRNLVLPVLPLVSFLCSLQTAVAAPKIIHVSDPVRPDETVILTGDSFGGSGAVELTELPLGAKGPLDLEALGRDERWVSITPEQSGAGSMKFVIPKDWPQGIWLCRVRTGGEVSAPVVLNAPSVWWWNGDSGETVSPGGWLRVFGKAVALNAQSHGRLTSASGESVALQTEESSAYGVRFAVPKDLPEGEYALSIHNGLGGEAAWIPARSRPGPR